MSALDSDAYFNSYSYPTPPSSPIRPKLSRRKVPIFKFLDSVADGAASEISPPRTPERCHTDLPHIPQSHEAAFELLSNRLNRRANIDAPEPFRRSSALKTLKFKHSTSDRFLPARRTPDASMHKFHANKDPKKLSPAERLIRHVQASPDAFNPGHRRTTSPPPTTVPGRPAGRPGSASTLTMRPDSPSGPLTERQVSAGAVWSVGGLAPLSAGVADGRGGLTGSGTNAPLYTTSFSNARPRAEEEAEQHDDRLAVALDLDRVQRVFEFSQRTLKRSISSPAIVNIRNQKTFWAGTEWITDAPKRKAKKQQEMRNLPAAPFKVLDAPNLRDDFYCSVLAYSHTSCTLAVGLGSMLYAWSEVAGVQLLNQVSANVSWITSVAFSSNEGCKSILAFGRSDGSITLQSLFDTGGHRFMEQQPCPVACISWKPTTTIRPSGHPSRHGRPAKTEDIIVGDEIGNVYYYAVEWPDSWEIESDPDHWIGCMTLVARISIHSQQICGLAWALDGSVFATGGNDNLCCLFETSRIVRPRPDQDSYVRPASASSDYAQREVIFFAGRHHVRFIVAGAEKHRWVHSAAVKAIAFCPWREGLIATGGGSNDKCIHFFHTVSGACLATISVSAQVTSLIWSTTRREIAATFGYAQPEHPYRIAVFSWPECKQVAAIPWEGEHRALYAIAYPGGPNDGRRSAAYRRGSISRTAQEGCIVVAASDESVKFHEVWTAGQRATSGGEGLLGGSDILEGLEGIDKEGEVIR